jgi:SpoVK/Ycf46/Vps4 family AAA+-type ATPase
VRAPAGAGDSAVAIAPLLAAVEQSGVVAAGSGAMEEVLVSMEGRLEQVLDHAEGEVRQIDLEAESQALEVAADTRRQIATMRSSLVEQATTLAYTFDAMLALLDDAERSIEGVTDADSTR